MRACVRAQVLALLLWALYIVPGLLEVFSLPPFLDELEHSLLLHTLKCYPNGRWRLRESRESRESRETHAPSTRPAHGRRLVETWPSRACHLASHLPL